MEGEKAGPVLLHALKTPATIYRNMLLAHTTKLGGGGGEPAGQWSPTVVSYSSGSLDWKTQVSRSSYSLKHTIFNTLREFDFKKRSMVMI